MISKHPDYMLVSTTFPMFGANIKRLWGSPEFKPYAKELIDAAMSGGKQAFPLDVLKALVRLDILHGKLHADQPPQAQMHPALQDNEDLQKIRIAFPAVAEQLKACWGRAEFGPYVSGLLQTNQGDGGQAFAFDTLVALHALIERHNKDFAAQFPAISLWAA